MGVTISYDPAYRTIRYPGGDVVHEDLKANWHSYPQQRRWGLAKPDANIDHRRVPNLMTFFVRSGYAAPRTRTAGDYLPGDVVAWDLGRGVLHIGMVSDRLSVAGTPLVVHNIGAGAREEDILFRYTIMGHYRLPPPASDGAAGATVATH